MKITTVRPPQPWYTLARAAELQRYDRKLLVCRRHGEGRELLRALAVGQTAWVGIEVVTPWSLAQALVAPGLAADGLAVADEFAVLALTDEAIDAVLQRHALPGLRALVDGAGLRRTLGDALHALRLAGHIDLAAATAAWPDLEKRQALRTLAGEYADRLQAAGQVDAAVIFHRANVGLETGVIAVPDGSIYIAPGHSRRGLSGRLLGILISRGAELLEGEPVAGLAPPAGRLRREGGPGLAGAESAKPVALSYLHDVAHAPSGGIPALEVFSAASVTDELREVLRRVGAAGVPWDAVEIVATDPVLYGTALDGLARRLGIPVTYAVGLPLERTRVGRALSGYLGWLRDDYPAETLRQLLEREDIRPEGEQGTGARLARRLRRLRIVRGRARYRRQLDRALARWRRIGSNPEGGSGSRVDGEQALLEALAGLILPILEATPSTEAEVGEEAAVSVAELATGALAFLARVPVEGRLEEVASALLVSRLERMAATLTRRAPFPSALVTLERLVEGRVPASGAQGPAPWSSAGGHLHFSDLEHGGLTRRAHTFIVGLDANRFPGSDLEDSILGDEERRRLTGGTDTMVLPTATERLYERRYALAELVARLRGRITFSYTAWESTEGRTVAPAAEILQAFRLQQSDAGAGYDRLHEVLGAGAAAVPRHAAWLDSDDVWLGTLEQDGVLRPGLDLVCQVYPGLAAGLKAVEARRSLDFNPYHGRIVPRPELDPRNRPAAVVSASRLEVLGGCPHRYMLRYVFHLRPPEDPHLEPDRWLDARERGVLLHTVFERTLRRAREQAVSPRGEAFVQAALAILDEELAAWQAEQPAPGEALRLAETEELQWDVRAFAAMVRADGREWVELERRFGREGEAAVRMALSDDRGIGLAGAIDRIDAEPNGDLVVVDYKTGSPVSTRDVFAGGRRLQHVLYAVAAERLLERRVTRVEYHYPTVKGRTDRAGFTRQDLGPGRQIVGRLLDIVAAGAFHPTDHAGDCQHCEFQAVCRVRQIGTRLRSPPAVWAAATSHAALGIMRELRR